MFKLFNLFIAFLVVSYSCFPQGSTDPTIILNGTVWDEYTKQPVGADIVLKKDGEIVNKFKSNEKTGMFQAVINTGGTYTVEINSWDIAKYTERIEVKSEKNYEEQKIDFYVKKLAEGVKFDSNNIFSNNTTEFVKTAKYVFEYYQEIMKFNRSVHFNFIVTAHDTYKEGASEAEIKTLVDNRIAVLQEEVNQWKRYKRRINIVADYSPGTEEADENIAKYDLSLIVSKMRNGLE